MATDKRPKKKISVSISQHNIDKIDKIVERNPEENRSNIIDTSLDLNLEEVAELLKNPLQLEEQLLKLKLKDIERMKKFNK